MPECPPELANALGALHLECAQLKKMLGEVAGICASQIERVLAVTDSFEKQMKDLEEMNLKLTKEVDEQRDLQFKSAVAQASFFALTHTRLYDLEKRYYLEEAERQ